MQSQIDRKPLSFPQIFQMQTLNFILFLFFLYNGNKCKPLILAFLFDQVKL